MTQRIIRAGNTLAVPLPQEVVDALELEEGSAVGLELTADGRQVLIFSGDVVPEGVDTSFAQQVADFIERYRPALDALAK